MAHEQSITIQKKNGRFVNISSMVGGRSSPKKATDMFRAGNRKALGGVDFPTVAKAVAAAKKRSKSFNGKK